MKRDDKLGPELADISEFPNPAAPKRTDLIRLATGLIGLASPVLGIASRVTNRMLGDDDATHFSITKLREGGNHAVIVINGFLSKGDLDTSDWQDAIQRKFRQATWYHLDWEAYRDPLKQLGDLFTLGGLSKKARGKSEPELWRAWHTTMLNAERAGKLLAEAILRTPGWRFTLAGHSLGARVIHFALKELAKQSRKRVSNVYLLGGAIGGSAKDDDCWEEAVSAVTGRIFNCYSSHDLTLQGAYQGANLMLSRPAGYAGIHFEHERIIDRDFSGLVEGHMKWKSNFGEILRRLAGG